MFHDLVEDIAKLGEEECAMLRLDSDDDDDGLTSEGKIRVGSQDERKVAAVESQGDAGHGKSEADAIELLDDDEDDGEVTVMETKPPAKPSDSISVPAARQSNPPPASQVEFNAGFRLYKLRLLSPKLGVELRMHRGRPFVSRGESLGKPGVGDIIVGINGWPLGLTEDMPGVVERLRAALKRVPSEITFAECPQLREGFLAAQEAQARALLESQNRAAAENVIEIDDDDDDD
jgi:hypothetical protein